jgi:hypothetical protein
MHSVGAAPRQPGLALWQIRQTKVSDWDLEQAQVNQGLELALSGLRTGNQLVPNNRSRDLNGIFTNSTQHDDDNDEVRQMVAFLRRHLRDRRSCGRVD